MNSADFWVSVRNIIAEGYSRASSPTRSLSRLKVCKNSTLMQQNSSAEGWYINDFHRRNSMAAQREVMQMSLHPCSREQKLAQIQRVREHSATMKESANAERSRKLP
jgi:hypothetical protein